MSPVSDFRSWPASIRNCLAALCALLAFASVHAAPETRAWSAITALAKGQTVYWNAWGGDERTNAFIAWAGGELKRRYGVTVQQVKLKDTAEAVSRVVAEKSAGRDVGGSVDLIWINGPNFLALKSQGLLFGPFTQALPNSRFVELAGQPPPEVDKSLHFADRINQREGG